MRNSGSKAFDKVWHEGLINKLKSNGIQGKLLSLIISFLSNRQQRGSVLGQLFFLVFINDLAEGLVFDVRLFADDTSLLSIVYDEQVSADILNDDLKFIDESIL